MFNMFLGRVKDQVESAYMGALRNEDFSIKMIKFNKLMTRITGKVLGSIVCSRCPCGSKRRQRNERSKKLS